MEENTKVIGEQKERIGGGVAERDAFLRLRHLYPLPCPYS